MTVEKMFESAVREKVRFSFRGLISVEDVWDLPLEDLDSIFKTLNSELKQASEESLLNTKTKENKELELKIEIIKYVVKTKLEEEKAKLEAKEKKEQKQKILEILASKKEEGLQNKSIEELESMLEDLD